MGSVPGTRCSLVRPAARSARPDTSGLLRQHTWRPRQCPNSSQTGPCRRPPPKFKVQDLEFRIHGLGCKVEGVVFTV